MFTSKRIKKYDPNCLFLKKVCDTYRPTYMPRFLIKEYTIINSKLHLRSCTDRAKE